MAFFKIFVTRDFDHMSRVAAGLVEADIKQKQAVKGGYVLGLATGNSPTGLYRYLAMAFNDGRIDAAKVRSFNLDEYVGLPGENAQQRCLHCESYSYFMIQQLFGLLERKFAETSVPWGTLVDQECFDRGVGAASRPVRDARHRPGEGHRHQGGFTWRAGPDQERHP